jgi:hypothetical protein
MNSNNNIKNTINEYVFGGINVFVKNPLSIDIDLYKFLGDFFDNIPKVFLQNIELILIGEFDNLKQRQVDAIFENGAIYITNIQRSEEDFLSDLVHEIAHSFEEVNMDFLYGDSLIENEFLEKRKKLYNELKSKNLLNNIEIKDFLEISYNKKFDDYLNNFVGYEALNSITSGYFLSAYGATSLREYFANAFEHYFVFDIRKVKKISEEVYKKIQEILEQENL